MGLSPVVITAPPLVIFIHLYGHLIEILISFQRSNCSSFPSHGLSKQPRLNQSIVFMNMLIKIGNRPPLEALQVSWVLPQLADLDPCLSTSLSVNQRRHALHLRAGPT